MELSWPQIIKVPVFQRAIAWLLQTRPVLLRNCIYTEWSRTEDKIFELALVQYPNGTLDRWSLITAKLPGKTLSQVLHHYQVLIHDLELIESGRVEILDYEDDEQEGDHFEILGYIMSENACDNFSEECPLDDQKISSGSSRRSEEGEQPTDP